MSEVVVLCYHAVSPSWDADLSVTPERLRQQMELLTARGYRAVTFSEAVGSPRDARVMAVTFDDAYRSVIELGLPILERLGIPATVFAVTDFVGLERPMSWAGIDRWLGGPHESELTPMSWPELRRLADAGWEIGSHTCSHPHLTTVDDDALARELAESKALCERELERPCTSLAYPYGDLDERVIAAAGRAGYAAAAALPRRTDSRRPLDWPRIGIYHTDGQARVRLKLSPVIGRIRRHAAWEVLDGLRRRAGI